MSITRSNRSPVDGPFALGVSSPWIQARGTPAAWPASGADTAASAVAGAGAAATTRGWAGRRGHLARAGPAGTGHGGEDRQQPNRVGVAGRARRRGVGIRHGAAKLEQGVAGTASVLIGRHADDR